MLFFPHFSSFILSFSFAFLLPIRYYIPISINILRRNDCVASPTDVSDENVNVRCPTRRRLARTPIQLLRNAARTHKQTNVQRSCVRTHERANLVASMGKHIHTFMRLHKVCTSKHNTEKVGTRTHTEREREVSRADTQHNIVRHFFVCIRVWFFVCFSVSRCTCMNIIRIEKPHDRT